jgi:maltose/maltodextrin transport system substrate-binding protein/arabinogalactan oligomer/maltooligosaccharide transport system substrate-binding protein
MLLAACGGGAEPTPVPAATEAPAAAAPTEAPAVEEPAPTEPPAAEEPAPTEPPAAEEPAPTEAPTAVSAVQCPAGSPTLTIWADKERSAVMIDLAPRVLEETGICLSVQEVGFGDIRSQANMAVPVGEGPDIFIGANDWIGEFVANGVVAEMDLGAKAADFDPVSLQGFTFDGRLRGVPYAVENVAFVCNSDLVPTPPTTYDEVRAMSEEAQADGALTQFFAIMASDPYHHEPINTAFGGYIFGQTEAGYDACDVGLDSEGAIAYLTWIDTMVKDGLLSPDINWDTAHQLFDTSAAACMITGPWAIQRFQDAGINYTINAVPAQTQDGSPFVGVQGFFVNAFSSNAVLAQSFLVDYIATQEVMEQLYLAGDRAPAYLPARGVLDDDAVAFAAAGAVGHPMPNITAMNAVWDSWGTAITTVFQQSATPADAAATAAAQVRAAAGCE